MRSFCEVYVKHVLPLLRLCLAEKLVTKYGFTQLEASRALGISQPLVNYIVNKRRIPRMAEKLLDIAEVMKVLDKTAEDLARREYNASNLACNLCAVLRRENVMDQIVKTLNHDLCRCER